MGYMSDVALVTNAEAEAALQTMVASLTKADEVREFLSWATTSTEAGFTLRLWTQVKWYEGEEGFEGPTAIRTFVTDGPEEGWRFVRVGEDHDDSECDDVLDDPDLPDRFHLYPDLVLRDLAGKVIERYQYSAAARRRYVVSKPYHGEHGTLWYVLLVDPADETSWEVVGSFPSREVATAARDTLNEEKGR